MLSCAAVWLRRNGWTGGGVTEEDEPEPEPFCFLTTLVDKRSILKIVAMIAVDKDAQANYPGKVVVAIAASELDLFVLMGCHQPKSLPIRLGNGLTFVSV